MLQHLLAMTVCAGHLKHFSTWSKTAHKEAGIMVDETGRYYKGYKIVSFWTFRIVLIASRLPAYRNWQDLAQCLNSCTVQFTNMIHKKKTKWNLNIDVTKVNMKWDITSAEETGFLVILKIQGNLIYFSKNIFPYQENSFPSMSCPVLQEICSVCCCCCSSPFDPSDGSMFFCTVCVCLKCVDRGPGITDPEGSQPAILNKRFHEHRGGWQFLVKCQSFHNHR